MKKLLFTISLLLMSVASFADSLITSTDFVKAYKDIPIVSTDVLELDFSEVFKICNSVISDSTLKQDMRPQAIAMMMEYIYSYMESCGEEEYSLFEWMRL